MKELKRYRHAPSGSGVPDGEYVSGIDNDEFRNLLGDIISLWTHIEERMAWVFFQLAHVKDEAAAKQLFRSISSQQLRIKLMRNMLQKSPLNQNLDAQWDEVIGEFERLNIHRNNYVHSLWYTHQSKRVFIAEKLDIFEVDFSWREVDLKEMQKVLNEAVALSQKIIGIWIAVRSG